MSFYIRGYHGPHRILAVAKSQETAETIKSEGKSYIFFSDNTTKIHTQGEYTDVSIQNLDINSLNDYDVIEVSERGVAEVIYQRMSKDNAVLVTMKCNSNCIMCPCSEQSRKHGFVSSIDRLREILEYTPKDAEYITVTGGEPWLLKNDMFEFLSILQQKFYNTEFFLLTNGRAFASKELTDKFIKCKPDKMRVAIPIYGYDALSHDSITQTTGSFEQSVQGIHNLLSHRMDIEIRIVVNKLNIKNMQKIAEYIVEHFKGIVVVHFMAIEMLGNAAKNADKVWIPYEDIFKHLREPITTVIKSGIDVELYNFPLCTVDREFWSLCRKSISEYKVRFTPACDKCKVKQLCGGMFDSTMRFCKFNPQPIIEG